MLYECRMWYKNKNCVIFFSYEKSTSAYKLPAYSDLFAQNPEFTRFIQSTQREELPEHERRRGIDRELERERQIHCLRYAIQGGCILFFFLTGFGFLLVLSNFFQGQSSDGETSGYSGRILP